MLVGCQAEKVLPPPEPKQPSNSILAIQMEVQIVLGSFFHAWTKFVVLARINDELPLSRQTDFAVLYFDSRTVGRAVNVPPGRYAVIAAGMGAPGHPTGTMVYLPLEVVRQSLVEVRPGAVAYMGNYVVNANATFDGADEAQDFYPSKLQRSVSLGDTISLISSFGLQRPGDLSFATPQPGTLRESHRDRGDEIAFWQATANRWRTVSPGSQWLPVIQKRIDELALPVAGAIQAK